MIEYLPRSQPIHRPHPFGDATEHDGEGIAVLLSILGNVHRVQDARVVEGSLSKLSERRGHVVGSGPTTGDSPSARTAVSPRPPTVRSLTRRVPTARLLQPCLRLCNSDGRWRSQVWSVPATDDGAPVESDPRLSLIHISEPTRRTPISYA